MDGPAHFLRFFFLLLCVKKCCSCTHEIQYTELPVNGSFNLKNIFCYKSQLFDEMFLV